MAYDRIKKKSEVDGMNMFDEARGILAMMEMRGLTQGEMARLLGVSQSYVANKLRLLGFSDDEQAEICEGGLSERHARALLRLSGERRRSAIRRTVERGYTVRECEALVDFLHDGEAPAAIGKAPAEDRIKKFTDTLEESVRTLRSLGIDASISRSYHGKKSYLTVCIKE